MFRVIDTIVREAYGERNGNWFIKVAPNGLKLADFFVNTEAYDNLLMELTKSEETLTAFIAGCLNKNAQERVLEELKKNRAENGGELKIPEVGESKPSLKKRCT